MLKYFVSFLFLFGCAVFVAVRGLSPAVENGRYSLVVALRLLIAVASCGAQALGRGGLCGCSMWAQQLWLMSLVAPWPVGSSRVRLEPVSPGKF